MQIVDTIAGTRQAIRDTRAAHPDGTLGLVPTMGALHAGHLSLIDRARRENPIVAASIFVNPLQFGPNEDLAKYPRTFADDCAQLERAGVDLLFAPTRAEMYPRGAAVTTTTPSTTVDPGPIANRLDGVSRPGHFIGVATVVAKLFHILQPDRAYFGQKDAAQLAILRQMVRDLDIPVDLIACPIVRDHDGLALSSRNRYLTPDERAQALILPRTLDLIAQRIAAGERRSEPLIAAGRALLEQHPEVVLDYLTLVDPDTLLPVPEASPGTLVAIAAKVGTTRLIDNFLLE
ncbi:MAG TPA: pantoate--beta-alanine ligase [Granulicella sp.]|jgi:pantoate--beta-alanine ligase|nr:pantoate--beta-alanine ligase [Granulicella sp.]